LENKHTLIVFVVIVLVVVVLNNLEGNFTGLARGGIPGKPNYQCSDGIDNDKDGYCDFLWKNAKCSDGSRPGDPGCISKDDNDESTDCLPVCYTNSDCGINDYIGSSYCDSDGNLYKDYQTFTCENAGKCSSVCNEQISGLLWQNCGNNMTCSNGACIPMEYCGDGICSASTESCSTCSLDCGSCPSVCGNGICETGEDSNNCSSDCPLAATCTDSDGGRNYYVKGNTSGLNAGGSPASFTDFCDASNRLQEYICGASGEVLFDYYTCSCSNGACITMEYCGDGICSASTESCSTCSLDCGSCPSICGDGICETGEDSNNCSSDCPPVATCTDSDGGRNYYVKGTTSGLNAGGLPASFTDFCDASSRLQEYICGTSGEVLFDYYTCSCSNGACLT